MTTSFINPSHLSSQNTSYLIFAFLFLCLSPFLLQSAEAAVSPSGLVSDAFNRGTLDSRWSFYDPLANSTRSMTGTQASISVPAGSTHDLWTNVLNAPRIRQAANNTDFDAVVKFDSKLSARYQMQGLTAEQNNTNLVRFSFHSDGSVVRLFSASFVNSTATQRISTVITAGVPLYLRVQRVGNQWTVSHSYNGTSWTVAGSFSHTLTVSSVGLFTGNAGSPAPAHTALIDSFTVDGLAPPADITVQYENGLESGTLAGLRPHLNGGSVAATTSPVATGKYAAKYDLIRDNTKGNYRAENYPDYEKNVLVFNTEYWLSMNYIRTNWVKDRSAEAAPFQIHRVPSQWKAGCGGEVSAFSVAPFVMFSQNDVEKIITNGGVVSWSGPVVKNQWQNIIFHFKITWDKTGYVEAWKDGKKLFRRDGKLHNQIDDCGQPFKSPVFKMGIYKWDWKLGSTQISYSNRRTLHIDNLRITKGPSLY